MSTRYYCDWCGSETLNRNGMTQSCPRHKHNSGYMYGIGPIIEAQVNITTNSGETIYHLCEPCMEQAIRLLLLGENVELPEDAE